MNTELMIGEDWGRRERGALLKPRFLLPIGIGVAAFIVDLQTPHGFVDGLLYVLAVLVCIWVPGVNTAWHTAFGVTPLMIIGWFASPIGATVTVGVTNVVVGIATVWIAASVVRHSARVSQERESLLNQIRSLQRMTVAAADNERTELSRWLHEGIGQELAAVGWGLDQIARRAGDADDVRTGAKELRAVIDGAQLAVRGKISGLRYPHAYHGGLRVLIERHAASFSARTQIVTVISGAECLGAVPESQADLCFRVVQEALTNAAKHSGASHVNIEFHARRETLDSIITDDGHGISVADQAKPDSLGLLGLRERLLAAGGTLNVSNVEPHGVRVEAKLPLR